MERNRSHYIGPQEEALRDFFANGMGQNSPLTFDQILDINGPSMAGYNQRQFEQGQQPPQLMQHPQLGANPPMGVAGQTSDPNIMNKLLETYIQQNSPASNLAAMLQQLGVGTGR
jgi:hypothetical protein